MATENQVLEMGLRASLRLPSLPVRTAKVLTLLAALALGALIWNMPPADMMGAKGMHFLATMVVAIALWVLDVFDEYVVGLMLLLSWVVCGIVSPKIALAGFSENSWFFTIGALGIAAAIGQTSLLQRLSLRLLRWIPVHCQKTYTLLLLCAGVFSGPLLPTGKARAAVAVPVSQAISEASGFDRHSNGSAAISLAAFIGFSQMSFMFLTGGEQCLIGWNFLPAELKAEFGWLSWLVVALPAAVAISVFMFFAIQVLFPLSAQETEALSTQSKQFTLNAAGPIKRTEWITLITLLLTVAGWLTKSLHGINEAWVALAALLVFLLSGILDKESFKNRLDWGLVLFFGVLNSMAVVAHSLKVDEWFMKIGGQLLARFAGEPFRFLVVGCLLIFALRFLVRKTAAAALFAVALLPLSGSVGIHPGVVLVVLIMAGECFLLGYQDGPYQIAYGGAGGNAFTHGQARKVLAGKYLATLLAVAVSLPYWRFLGFIR